MQTSNIPLLKLTRDPAGDTYTLKARIPQPDGIAMIEATVFPALDSQGPHWKCDLTIDDMTYRAIEDRCKTADECDYGEASYDNAGKLLYCQDCAVGVSCPSFDLYGAATFRDIQLKLRKSLGRLAKLEIINE